MESPALTLRQRSRWWPRARRRIFGYLVLCSAARALPAVASLVQGQPQRSQDFQGYNKPNNCLGLKIPVKKPVNGSLGCVTCLACRFPYPAAQAGPSSEVNPSVTKSADPLSPTPRIIALPCGHFPSCRELPAASSGAPHHSSDISQRDLNRAKQGTPFPPTLSSLSRPPPLPWDAVEPQSGAKPPARQLGYTRPSLRGSDTENNALGSTLHASRLCCGHRDVGMRLPVSYW